ncbi:hypothetical protein KJ903_01555 [Patescibacteria group bacterium]|nr:hypothetical protein [Patescibacteria group bacterium]
MGIIVYGVLVGGKMDISRITPVIFGATFALTAVFSWLLLGELFTDKKVIGFILMAIAVFLLK